MPVLQVRVPPFTSLGCFKDSYTCGFEYLLAFSEGRKKRKEKLLPWLPMQKYVLLHQEHIRTDVAIIN